MMKKLLIISALSGFVFLMACEKTSELLDVNTQWQLSDTAANAQVKFVHAFASTTPALTSGAGPSLQIWANGKKVTGTTATLDAVAYSGQFPASTAYSLLPAGQTTFYFIMNRWTGGVFAPVAGDTVFKTTQTLVAGKKYSIYLVDTVPTPNVIMVEDTWTPPDFGTYKIRYTNLVANPTDRYDVYSLRNAKNIFTNVGYKEFTPYISLPAPATADTLIVRRTGTMTLIDSVKGFFPTGERVYTLFSRGKTGVTGRTPATTWTTNR